MQSEDDKDADKPLDPAVERLRAVAGLAGAETLRREGAPIPMKPLKRWHLK